MYIYIKNQIILPTNPGNCFTIKICLLSAVIYITQMYVMVVALVLMTEQIEHVFQINQYLKVKVFNMTTEFNESKSLVKMFHAVVDVDQTVKI